MNEVKCSMCYGPKKGRDTKWEAGAKNMWKGFMCDLCLKDIATYGTD